MKTVLSSTLMILSYNSSTMLSYNISIQHFTKLQEFIDYSTWKQLIKYSLVSEELWNMISEKEKESQKTSASMMTAEFMTTITAENQQWIDWKIKNNHRQVCGPAPSPLHAAKPRSERSEPGILCASSESLWAKWAKMKFIM